MLLRVVGLLAQLALEQNGVPPNLGASGPIAGVMGAYQVFSIQQSEYGFLCFGGLGARDIRLGMWGAIQLCSGFGSIA